MCNHETFHPLWDILMLLSRCYYLVSKQKVQRNATTNWNPWNWSSPFLFVLAKGAAEFSCCVANWSLQVGGKNASKNQIKINLVQQKLLIAKYTISIKGMLLQIFLAVLQIGVFQYLICILFRTETKPCELQGDLVVTSNENHWKIPI